MYQFEKKDSFIKSVFISNILGTELTKTSSFN